MKITMSKIADSFTVLYNINNRENIGFKIKYWAMRNIKILAESYNFYIEQREELYEKYCCKSKGNSNHLAESYFIIDPHTNNIVFNIKNEYTATEFTEKINELCSMECENITPYILKADIINNSPDFDITGDEMLAIDYLLEL